MIVGCDPFASNRVVGGLLSISGTQLCEIRKMAQFGGIEGRKNEGLAARDGSCDCEN